MLGPQDEDETMEPPKTNLLDMDVATDAFITKEYTEEIFNRSLDQDLNKRVIDMNDSGSAYPQKRRAPPPYIVHSFHGAQSHYESSGACPWIAMLIVWYMLKSKWRAMDAMEWWLEIGCWLYKLNETVIPKMQTKNPKIEDQTYISPITARDMIETTRNGLMLMEEISGIIDSALPEDNDTSNNTSKTHIDKQYIDQGAFVPLWKVIRRLFFFALSYPVGATFVSSINFIHSLGIRWNADVTEETRSRMRALICPEGPDHYDRLEEPTLEELDAAINAKKFFIIDFVDSHLNDPERGLPGDTPENSSAVWIEFSKLQDIRDYIQERYPLKKDNEKSLDWATGRKNAFDMILWKAVDDAPDSGDIHAILTNSAFLEWRKQFRAIIDEIRRNAATNNMRSKRYL